MVCDRVAACKVYLGDKYDDSSSIKYYEHAKKYYYMHEKTAQELEFVLEYLAENGEDKMAEFLKKKYIKKQ